MPVDASVARTRPQEMRHQQVASLEALGADGADLAVELVAFARPVRWDRHGNKRHRDVLDVLQLMQHGLLFRIRGEGNPHAQLPAGSGAAI